MIIDIKRYQTNVACTFSVLDGWSFALEKQPAALVPISRSRIWPLSGIIQV